MNRLTKTIPRLGLALVAASFVVALTLGAEARASGPGSPFGLMDCGPGVPLVKCNASLYTPPPTAGGAALPTPARHSALAPEYLSCASGFLSKQQVAALNDQFGTLQCLRVVNSADWIIIGDGISTTAPIATGLPGGGIVAVLICPQTDSRCLDPSSLHDFGDFTVLFPPNPTAGRVELQTIGYGRFLMIADGTCGLFALDLKDLKWYAAPGAVARLRAGDAEVANVAVPAPRPAKGALGRPAPGAVADVCQPLIGG